MFLRLLQRRNPDLLRDAARLHQAGSVPANCYVIDLDAVTRNARGIADESRRLGLRTFAMTKQVGRNPDMITAIQAGGIDRAVAVDMEDAIADAAAGLRIGHLGHLVQVPQGRVDWGARLAPDYWTIFSEHQLALVAAAARGIGRTQDVLLRIYDPGDRFYPGHEGGFDAQRIVEKAKHVDTISGVRFAGITTFPALLFDENTGDVSTTPNLATLTRARDALQAAGFDNIEVNAPGTTSTATLPIVANAGATQVEPGHGLTGTTPWHAVRDLVEQPAIAYISEISHEWSGRSYVIGGGLYVDPVINDQRTDAVVVTADDDPAAARPVPVEMPAPESIDYYAAIPNDGTLPGPGSTVIFGFRPQVFVTRGMTAGLVGVGTASVRVAGLWSANGTRPLDLTDALRGLGRQL